MTTLWIKNPMAIFTANDQDARGGLLISNGKIIELIALGQNPKHAYDAFFDASQLVITPGLINSHHHFYQTLTRAWAPVVNAPLFPWLTTLYPVWAKLNPEQLHLATQIALSELLLSGCTFAADHHYLFPQQLTDAIDIQVNASTEIGLSVEFPHY
jgi:8-oxoguanine deaminase